jgi:hypothetical protein
MRFASLQPHCVLFGGMLANGQHEIGARAVASADGLLVCSSVRLFGSVILPFGFATPKFGKTC